jgi:hypothetical protein
VGRAAVALTVSPPASLRPAESRGSLDPDRQTALPYGRQVVDVSARGHDDRRVRVCTEGGDSDGEGLDLDDQARPSIQALPKLRLCESSPDSVSYTQTRADSSSSTVPIPQKATFVPPAFQAAHGAGQSLLTVRPADPPRASQTE